MARQAFTIPDEHVAWIGRITDAWAQLEFHIDQGIWHLANTEQQLAACITAQMMSAHPRLKAFGALVAVRGGSEASVKDVKSFAGNISDLSDKRNRSAHDPRYKNTRTDEVARLEITAKPKVHFGFVPESIDDLKDTFEKIRKKVDEFIELRNRIIAEIEALPPESQPKLVRIVPVLKVPPNPASEGK